MTVFVTVIVESTVDVVVWLDWSYVLVEVIMVVIVASGGMTVIVLVLLTVLVLVMVAFGAVFVRVYLPYSAKSSVLTLITVALSKPPTLAY